jgi:hypothetical protein
MENKNQPINPLPADTDSSRVECKGLTKREYFAGKYVDVANHFFLECTADYILECLGLTGVKYDPFIHFPMAVTKMQLLFADELLKQLGE